jgi:Zn-dependent protease
MFILSLLQSPLDFIAVLVGFMIIGITVHEFAHAWVANKYGDPTAKMEGRVSLNPLAHLDPVGTVLFFIIGFGWGKPVPTNPHFLRHKKDELKVAIAGIVANLLVATLLAIPIRIASLKGILIDSEPILLFLKKLVEINVVLAAFNILPIPPLDGSHFVEYFLGEEEKFNFQRYGQYILFGLIMFDFLTGYSIFLAIMEPIMRAMLFFVSGIPLNPLV